MRGMNANHMSIHLLLVCTYIAGIGVGMMLSAVGVTYGWIVPG